MLDNKLLLLRSWQGIAIVTIIISFFLQWYAHSCGLLLTIDSLNYLSAASSFSESGDFINENGTRYIYWPPLFPILLSLLGSPLIAFFWINFILSAGISIVCAILAKKLIPHIVLRSVYLITIACGVHLMMISAFLWSELFFIFLLLMFLVFFEKAEHDRKSLNIATAVLFGILLCLQRNAGVFIVFGAVIWYLLKNKSVWPVRFFKAMSLFVITSSGFWIWNAYVYNLNPLGFEVHHQESFRYLAHNFNLISYGIMNAYLPVRSWSVLWFLVFLAGIVLILRRSLMGDWTLSLMSFIIVSYIIGITVSFKLDFDESDRFSAVILPFFGLIVFNALNAILDKKKSIAPYLVALVMLWMAYPLGRTLKNIHQWHYASCHSYS